MSFTFDPYKVVNADICKADDVLMTNPTALQELEGYWRSLPKVQGVPERKNVDPSAMGNLLEDSFILERVAPGVARVRVAGRNIGKLIGVEPRGLPVTSFFTPESRTAISGYLEMVFNGPKILEIPLASPRSTGKPALDGKILLLPLRDDHGHVNRVLGVLVMSGRRGIGPRRFEISEGISPRIDQIGMLRAVETVRQPRGMNLHPNADQMPLKKAESRPTLRLVVSNP